MSAIKNWVVGSILVQLVNNNGCVYLRGLQQVNAFKYPYQKPFGSVYSAVLTYVETDWLAGLSHIQNRFGHGLEPP